MNAIFVCLFLERKGKSKKKKEEIDKGDYRPGA